MVVANAFKKRSKKLDIARKLPPCFHKLPGCDFNPKDSQAINWLIQQPSVLEFLWDNIKQSGDVIYDPESGKWRGVDFHD